MASARRDDRQWASRGTRVRARGARVLVIDRDRESAEETVRRIADIPGAPGAVALAADITVAADCDMILQVAVETFGMVDVLHNNVGVVTVESTGLDDWQSVIDIHLTGLWSVTKKFLPVLRGQGHGVITNISSLASVLAGATPVI